MKLMYIMLRSIPVINRFRAMKVNVSYLKDTTEVCGREIPNKHIELPLVFQTAYFLKQLV